MSTLEIISRTHPRMVHSLEKLPNYQLESLVVEIIKRIGMKRFLPPTLHQALLTISSTGAINPDPSATESLRQVSENLDEEYFILEEAGAEEALWKAKFQAARIAYALSEISRGVSLDTFGQFIYEMAYASGSPDTFLENMEKEIERMASGAEGYP